MWLSTDGYRYTQYWRDERGILLIISLIGRTVYYKLLYSVLQSQQWD